MFKSRKELRGAVSGLDATIATLHTKYPIDLDFFRSTDGIFTDVLGQAGREDEDWVFDLIDSVCTRHGMPFPET